VNLPLSLNTTQKNKLSNYLTFLIKKKKSNFTTNQETLETVKMKKSKQNNELDAALPELEFGQPANERTKLIGSASRKSGAVMDLRVNLGGQKSNQEIKQVNTKTVCDYVEALNKVDADCINQYYD